MSKLTVTIPDDLHQKIREELERQGITTSQFIEQAVTTFFEKPKGVSNMATRTLAFQVSEELLQRIKTFLARYKQIYHRKLSQKEFLAHLIERELDEAEKDYERITTEQAAEENADVDSGEPDGTEMEVDEEIRDHRHCPSRQSQPAPHPRGDGLNRECSCRDARRLCGKPR